MESIAVHNGKFHADDVFATAILKLIYPDLKVIRTRDPKALREVDARVDVGGKYSHETLDYDHHQSEMSEVRENGIKYAAAGLIWKHYGMKLVSCEEVWQRIEEKIIQYIDADDNGQKFYDAEFEPYTLREIILAFNPEWPNKRDEFFDKNFFEVVDIVIKLLSKEIEIAESLERARKIISEQISKCDKEYLILGENMPFQDAVRDGSEKIKFVIKEDPVESSWAIIGVQKERNNFEVRKKLPEAWGGLSGENLAKVTGVSDAVFCHKALFIIVVGSRESAIKLVEVALENGEA